MQVRHENQIDIYRMMVRIRTFEERMIREYEAGHFPGWLHSYIGQEAIAAGACAHLKPDDYITSTHRGHGHLIAKGGRMDRIAAELYGKITGYNRGKGGSMHVADISIGMLGANGINGAGIPIAAGCALSAQIRGTDQVTVCFFGDGAAGVGAFHEGINFASTNRLAVIYVIENNQWFVSARTRDCINVDSLASRADAYGIPGVSVDGNDVLAVYELMGKAVDRARNGDGPTLVECQTYRLRGHMEGDPQTYKPAAEQQEWESKDPLRLCEHRLTEMDILTESTILQVRSEAEAEMDAAVKFAEESAFPNPQDVLEDVFV